MLHMNAILYMMSVLMAGGGMTPVVNVAEPPIIIIENEKTEAEYAPVEAPPQPQQNNPAVGYYDRKSWWFKRNTENTPPSAQQDIAIDNYDAYYLGDTQRKTIYLTFDEGYENGYSEKILDVLKEYDVKAAFFVTKSYIRDNTELIKRMVAEGHVVGNHSVTHPDMTTLTDEQIASEINDCAEYFKEITGQDMPHFFRPPEGVYSIHSLEQTQAQGYKTIFWSFAYGDWDVNKQPGKQAAYDMVMNNYHILIEFKNIIKKGVM